MMRSHNKHQSVIFSQIKRPGKFRQHFNHPEQVRHFNIWLKLRSEDGFIVVSASEKTSAEIRVKNSELNDASDHTHRTFREIRSVDMIHAIIDLINNYDPDSNSHSDSNEYDDEYDENEGCESGEVNTQIEESKTNDDENNDDTENDNDDDKVKDKKEDENEIDNEVDDGDDDVDEDIPTCDDVNGNNHIVKFKRKRQCYGDSPAVDSIFNLFSSHHHMPSYRKLSEESNIPHTTIHSWHLKFKEDPSWRPEKSNMSHNRKIFSAEEETQIKQNLEDEYISKEKSLTFNLVKEIMLKRTFKDMRPHSDGTVSTSQKTLNFKCSRKFMDNFLHRNGLSNRMCTVERKPTIDET